MQAKRCNVTCYGNTIVLPHVRVIIAPDAPALSCGGRPSLLSLGRQPHAFISLFILYFSSSTDVEGLPLRPPHRVSTDPTPVDASIIMMNNQPQAEFISRNPDDSTAKADSEGFILTTTLDRGVPSENRTPSKAKRNKNQLAMGSAGPGHGQQSLNHLLNFTLPPRQSHAPHSLPRRSRKTGSGYGVWNKESEYNLIDFVKTWFDRLLRVRECSVQICYEPQWRLYCPLRRS